MSDGGPSPRRPPLGGVRHPACRRGERPDSRRLAPTVTSLTRTAATFNPGVRSGGVGVDEGEVRGRRGRGAAGDPPERARAAALPTPSILPFGFAARRRAAPRRPRHQLVVVGVGAAVAIVFGFLWAATRRRPRAAEPGRAAGRRAEQAAGRRRGARSRALPRDKFLERSTLGLGAADRRRRHDPGRRLRGRAGRSSARATRTSTSGRSRTTPRASSSSTTSGRARTAASVSRPHGLHPQQRVRERRPELHDPLEQLRPPRLPGAAERADATRRDGDRDRLRRVRLIPTQPAGFGCPCHGGAYDTEGNRTAGPAGTRARPLRVHDRERQPRARPAATASARSRARARRRRSTATSLRPGPARRRPGGVALPDLAARELRPMAAVARRKSARRQQPEEVAARARRLARGALGPGRRASSTSSSATSPRTSAGCRRSARRR